MISSNLYHLLTGRVCNANQLGVRASAYEFDRERGTVRSINLSFISFFFFFFLRQTACVRGWGETEAEGEAGSLQGALCGT